MRTINPVLESANNLLIWAKDDFTKLQQEWAAYCQESPFSLIKRQSAARFDIVAVSSRSLPSLLSKRLHNAANALKHCFDQVTSGVCRASGLNDKNANFPWAE